MIKYKIMVSQLYEHGLCVMIVKYLNFVEHVHLCNTFPTQILSLRDLPSISLKKKKKAT